MGRKNHRRKRRCDYNPLADDFAREFPNLVRKVEPYEGRCAYCGRLLRPGGWHWMRDEFGQMVKKCNNERDCSAHRRRESEKSFRKAMRM